MRKITFPSQKMEPFGGIYYTFTTLATSTRGERAEGIEPSCVAWKATVLPLNYARIGERGDVAGTRGQMQFGTRKLGGEGARVAADVEVIARTAAAHGDGGLERGGEVGGG